MKRFGIVALFTISIIAVDGEKKHVVQERYHQKQLPYAYDKCSKRCLIIQSPKHDGHVHTIKRTQKTIQALYEQQFGQK